MNFNMEKQNNITQKLDMKVDDAHFNLSIFKIIIIIILSLKNMCRLN